jgi:ubiquinone/menaquinone biosynthesis C-methylase UbiE
MLNGRTKNIAVHIMGVNNRVLSERCSMARRPGRDGPDATIIPLQENVLIIENQFSDAGVAAQFYGTSVNHVVANNVSTRTGGFLNQGSYYHHFQPSWYVRCGPIAVALGVGWIYSGIPNNSACEVNMISADRNLDSYNSPAALEQYTKASKLAACEEYLFDKYVDRGQEILDLGVGGGRTTPYLAAQASLYVGLDYSKVMVDLCRRQFPSLCFVCDDASDLQRFTANSFDVVVFSLNGIDSIRTDRDRTRCFREVARVLRPGGCFIFSSHNVRSIGFSANLRKYLFDNINNKTSLVSQVRSVVHEWGLGLLVRHFLRSIRISIQISLRKLLVPGLYRGTGYFFDYSHGGLILFASTPEYILAEAKNAGFEMLEMVSNTYPVDAPDYSTQWYYYVLRVGPA